MIWSDMYYVRKCATMVNRLNTASPRQVGRLGRRVAPQFWAAQPVSQRIDSSKHFLKRSHWQPWRWWGDNGDTYVYILHNIYTLLHNSIHISICKWYNSDIYIYIIFIYYMYIHYVYTIYIYIYIIYIHNMYTYIYIHNIYIYT